MTIFVTNQEVPATELQRRLPGLTSVGRAVVDTQGIYCVRCGSGNGEEHSFCICDNPSWDAWIMPAQDLDLSVADLKNFRVIPAAGYRYLEHEPF